MKHLVIGLGGVTALATLATISLVLVSQPVLAAIIGTVTACFWLALLVVSTIAITAWWTRETMKAGADIALVAQTSDDKRDVAMIKAVSSLTQAMMRQNQAELPALPLPSQQDWLPALNEFSEGEFEKVD